MSSTKSSLELLTTAADLPERLTQALGTARADGNHDRRFAPELSYGRHFGPAPHTARPAGVIALLFRRAGRWHLPLTVRPATLVRHGGQICFPGGTSNLGESTQHTAVRELAEELGIHEPVQLLGPLNDCYVYASDFLVTPWLAATNDEPLWRPLPQEVERVVELPLDLLLDPRHIGSTTIQRGALVFRAPCIRIGQECIWGATAIILSELAEALRRCLH